MYIVALCINTKKLKEKKKAKCVFNRKMDKQIVVGKYSAIKKEWTTDKCNKMDDPQKQDVVFAKCGTIPCIYSIYMKFKHRQN